MTKQEQLTDDEIETAENNQCDALCKPDFHKHPDGSVVCFGCERMVVLVPSRQFETRLERQKACREVTTP